MTDADVVVQAFQRAAAGVPAYRQILAAAGVDAAAVTSREQFTRLVPILDKQGTFGTYTVAELCVEGDVGRPASVLTSSGHSGLFAFGLYDPAGGQEEVERTDAALDMIFAVKTRPTLLINCLPMGVKVFTRACTLGETSVRPDMVTALVRQFSRHYEQVILVGEAAFLKCVLERGAAEGIDWHSLCVHAIVGEEPLAENARKYLEGLLGITPGRPETGLIGSSMGVAEIALNLMFELPPLIALRRRLHEDAQLRTALLGPDATVAPMIFTYDSERIFVEFDDAGRLLATTLDPARRLPLIRYATGDVGAFVPPAGVTAAVAMLGISADQAARMPIVLIHGRGQGVAAGQATVYPEQVKEGIYADVKLAAMTTANFRLVAGAQAARVRIQLAPGVAAPDGLAERFAKAIAPYVRAPIDVVCEPYETFGSGMSLDYERKFDYTGP